MDNFKEEQVVNFLPNYSQGTFDAAPDLEAFIMANPGKRVHVNSRDPIHLSNFGNLGVLTDTIGVDIDFHETVIRYSNDAPAVYLNNTDNASEEYTVSAISNVTLNSDSEVTRLTLSAASSVQAHQWVAVYSDDENPSKSGGRMGQIHQVLQDETGDPYVYLAGKVGKISQFTTNIKMRILDQSRKIKISGGVWTPSSDADNLAITTREECIAIIGFVDPEVRNVGFKAPWAQGVWFQCCGGGIMDTYQVTDTLNNGASNGYTYGCVLYGMNGNCVVKNGIVRNCRHPGGTTDGNSGSTSTWWKKGEPTNCVFTDIQGYNCYGSVTDSHEEGCFTTYRNITVNNALQDERTGGGAFVGRAHQSRSFNEIIENVTAIGCSEGISFDDIDHGEEDTVLIKNITIKGVHDGSQGAVGLSFRDNAQTNKRQYRLFNYMCDDTDKAILCGDENKLTYQDVAISRCDMFMDVHDGTTIFGSGSQTFDFTNSTASAASYVFYVRSAAASEPNIRLLTKPVVIKGSASNEPASLFHEGDTTANKNVWHPGIIEFDNGNTATLSKSSGSSTFVNLTDVNETAL